MLSDDKVYKQILKAIVEHELPPGAKLPEDKLAEAFNISRTGIRKVLQRLAIEKLVVIQPNKGAHVNRPSPQQAKEVLNSRIMIEPLLIPDIAASWTVQHSQRFVKMVELEEQANLCGDLAEAIHLTAKFHYELAKLSGNSILAEFVERLCYHSSLIIAVYGNKKSVHCEGGDHLELLELLDNKETEQAVLWMREHLVEIQSTIHLTDTDITPIDFTQLFNQHEDT
ncbi:GntR family transcriptional regulator [Vibrio sp. E150_011]